MKRLTILSSAIALAAGWQLASAQPPGGRGGFTPPTFDAINMADDEGKKDDHLTLDEIRAYFATAFAGRGGPPGGGGGGGGGAGGGGGGPGGGGAGGPGGGDFVANIFGQWDADDDGMVTRKEFDERPQGRGGRGGGGGPPPQ